MSNHHSLQQCQSLLLPQPVVQITTQALQHTPLLPHLQQPTEAKLMDLARNHQLMPVNQFSERIQIPGLHILLIHQVATWLMPLQLLENDLYPIYLILKWTLYFFIIFLWIYTLNQIYCKFHKIFNPKIPNIYILAHFILGTYKNKHPLKWYDLKPGSKWW